MSETLVDIILYMLSRGPRTAESLASDVSHAVSAHEVNQAISELQAQGRIEPDTEVIWRLTA